MNIKIYHEMKKLDLKKIEWYLTKLAIIFIENLPLEDIIGSPSNSDAYNVSLTSWKTPKFPDVDNSDDALIGTVSSIDFSKSSSTSASSLCEAMLEVLKQMI